MASNVVTKLDAEANGIDFEIYEVDGLNGTLKELADWFNVDPVSVSDGLLAGLEIQDALCAAVPGFKPEKIIQEEKEQARKAEALKKAKEEKQKKALQEQKRKAEEKARKERAKRMAEEQARLDKARKAEKEKMERALKKPAVQKQAVQKHDLSNEKKISSEVVTSVQDLGEVLVITTTTTVIYRK